MRRTLFNLAAAVSLLLCAAEVGAWLRAPDRGGHILYSRTSVARAPRRPLNGLTFMSLWKRRSAPAERTLAVEHPRRCAECGADRFYDDGMSFWDGPEGSGIGYFVRCAECDAQFVARPMGNAKPLEGDWKPHGQ